MKVSLIMPTVNREKEVIDFLDSLVNQTYKNFELIVIDQNKELYISEILKKYENKIEVKYIKSYLLGLSKNRNIGIKKAQGEILAFPDDDCIYEPKTLEKMIKFFKMNKEISIYTCNIKDLRTEEKIFFREKYSQEISYDNNWTTCISITIFIRLDSKIFFDEEFGVGAKYGSGEETDYIIKLLNNGYKGYYDSENFVRHPKPGKETKQKFYNYALGKGAVLRKNSVIIKVKKILLINIIKSIIGFILKLDIRYIYRIFGLIRGFCIYNNNNITEKR